MNAVRDERARGGFVGQCALLGLLCVAGVQFYAGAVYCVGMAVYAGTRQATGAAALGVVGVGEGLLSAAVFWVLVWYLRRAVRTWGLRPWPVRAAVYGLACVLLAREYFFGSLVGRLPATYVVATALLAALVAGIEYFNSAVIEMSDGESPEQRGGDRVEA